jgi:4'-phosphopantetheinyl transferase EntD
MFIETLLQSKIFLNDDIIQKLSPRESELNSMKNYAIKQQPILKLLTWKKSTSLQLVFSAKKSGFKAVNASVSNCTKARPLV